MVKTKRVASVAGVLGLAVLGVAAMPHDAKAWWRGGFGVGIVVPPVVVAPAPVYVAPPVVVAPPPVYVAPPVAYAPPPPAYYPAPHRVWVPPHWEGPYWVGGHWS
ncbi:MAG: hypothetical protein P4L90_15855 [Rhodopila sp.]|nr:hypothetical protein [Rhodopila sp.]